MSASERPSIVVLVSGSGSNLQAFIDAIARGELDANIALVISNRSDAFGLERARRAGIATATVLHTDFTSREAFDQALIGEIDRQQPAAVILAGFMRILTPAFVSHYLGRLLNIHPSLLPLYPGLHTHQRALENQDSLAGSTVHFVTAQLDGGPAILQAEVEILPGDDAAALAARVLTQEHRIYPRAVQWLLKGRLLMRSDGAQLDGERLGPQGVRIAVSCEELPR
ncbi:MAG: phosphoribosylglycinamide formyltransferase [Porticoccaceae bacterium]